MDAKIPTHGELQARYQDTLAATIPEGDADDADGFLFGLSHAFAAIDMGLFDKLGQLYRDAFRGSASREALVKIATPEVGAPTPSTAATIAVLLTGTAGATFAAGIELWHEELAIGATTTAGGTFDDDGQAIVAATVDEDAGAAGRFVAGTELRVLATAGGDPTATTVGDPRGGTDDEETEDYRERALDFVRTRGANGRAGYLRAKALTIAGVVKAADFPALDGYGSHAVAVCGEDNAPVSAAVLAAVEAAINDDDFRISAVGRYYALNSTAKPTAITLRALPRSSWAFSHFANKTIDEGSTTTQLNLSDVEDLAIGSWIVVEYQARQVVTVGATYVTVAALAAAPTVGAIVRPGCAIWATLYARVLEMIYDLEPGEILAPAMESDRFKLAELVDFAFALPAASVTPIVNADTCEIVTPGTIIIEELA